MMMCKFCEETELKGMAKSMKWYISQKYNGTRVLFMNGKLFNRDGLNVSNKYPHIIDELKGMENCILDGEIAVEKDGRTDLYLVQLKDNRKFAKFFIFDMIKDENGRDISSLTLNARLLYLEEQLWETDCIKIVPHTLFTEKSFELIKQLKLEKKEGFVLKLIKSPYIYDENNAFKEDRTIYWKKFKFLINYEVNIQGYNDDKKHHSYGSIITDKGKVGLLTTKNYEIFLSQKPKKAIVRGEAELSQYNHILKPILMAFILENGTNIPTLKNQKEAI